MRNLALGLLRFMDKNSQIAPIESDFPTITPAVQRLPEFVHFIKWYSTPLHYRNPKTQKEFAASIGVCVDTLTDWKKHPMFSFFVWQTIKEWLRERVPDVIGGLYLKASSEKVNAKDVELYLRLAEVDIINNNKFVGLQNRASIESVLNITK